MLGELRNYGARKKSCDFLRDIKKNLKAKHDVKPISLFNIRKTLSFFISFTIDQLYSVYNNCTI